MTRLSVVRSSMSSRKKGLLALSGICNAAFFPQGCTHPIEGIHYMFNLMKCKMKSNAIIGIVGAYVQFMGYFVCILRWQNALASLKCTGFSI